MAGRASEVSQIAAITKVIEITSHAREIREHVGDIVRSSAFKGSRRSQEFLQYIVDKALDGHFDELKERTLGVELFGRPASYDTGQDAIVRVTASDVRRRLVQFYAGSDLHPEFRVDLPAGSYIPEFRCVVPAGPIRLGEPASAVEVVRVTAGGKRVSIYLIALILIALIAAAAALGAGAWSWNQHRSSSALERKISLPWSALLQPDRQLQVVLCDPDMSAVQRLLDFNITLSDYANRRYVPEALSRSSDPSLKRIVGVFRGVNVASIDVGIGFSISELALSHSRHPRIRTARSLQLTDFKTEDNFVLLGSPRSNPWTELFEDQLDFTFFYDESLKQEVVQNKRPRAGELPLYVPTAQGWGTGQGYAIMAFVANPNQSGHVLLLAGSNAEGTEAVGKLAANVDLLARTLKSHGIDPAGAARPFELLLRVRTMAGSPSAFEVIAVHALPNPLGN
jgi:hypothetical protein